MNWLTNLIRRLTQDKDAQCPTCEGDGLIPTSAMQSDGRWFYGEVVCPDCNGAGRVTHEQRVHILLTRGQE